MWGGSPPAATRGLTAAPASAPPLRPSATPPALRGRACRLLGAKCALMARCDAHREDPAGGTGARMRASCAAKIAKWQEPPPARTVKPLPLPDMEPKKRRGGRRLRQLKERFGATDLRVAANRVNFNQPEEEAGLEGVGLGLVGAQGGGRLRATVAAGQSKRLQKEAAKFTRQKFSGPAGAAALSGLTSSVAFTPVQGIELAAPGRTAPSLPTGGADSVFGRGFTRAPGSGGAQQRQA